LPEDVNSENIEASYHDGILHITMPKKEEAKKLLVKNISVK
jgi:HSP20 family protein